MENQRTSHSLFYPKMPSQDRIDLTLCCICAGVPAPLVKREIARGCRVTPRMADKVVRNALTVYTDSKIPYKVLKCQSLAWYQTQLMDPNCPKRLQFRARKQMDILLGLYSRDAWVIEEEEEEQEAARIRAEERVAVEKTVIAELLKELSNVQLRVLADVHKMIRERVDAKLGTSSDESARGESSHKSRMSSRRGGRSGRARTSRA